MKASDLAITVYVRGFPDLTEEHFGIMQIILSSLIGQEVKLLR